MSSDGKVIEIDLMGRSFKVACPDGEEMQLRASVQYLNRRMQEIKASGKVVGNERIALLAALNITHEFLTNGAKVFDSGELQRRIERLQASVDDALAAHEP